MQPSPPDHLGKSLAAIGGLLIALRFILVYEHSLGTTSVIILYLLFIAAVVAVAIKYY